MKKRPPYYEGSSMAPDLANDEPLVVFDVENHQVLNMRAGIGKLFDILEDKAFCASPQKGKEDKP
jgi:hypothetical protein